MSSGRVRKQKTITYKRVEFAQPGPVLEILLNEAFSQVGKPSERTQVLGSSHEDSGFRHVIGSTKNENTMRCGAVYRYERGRDVLFVMEDDNADEYRVEQQNPSITGDGETSKRELLEASSFFGVVGNHVVLVQSAALKSRQIESHLNWLLKECVSVLNTENTVSLSDEPTESARSKIENLPVKNVEVGTPLNSELAPISSTSPQSSTHRIGGKGRDILEAFLGKGFLSTLDLDSALDDANLEITLNLRYLRKTSNSGHAALDKIARAMRHAEPEDTRVVTGSGAVINGDDLRLSGKITVDTNNGVVDSNDLFTQMYQWLHDRIEDGSVG